MGIITISRGSYSKGKEIAEKLAEAIGYKCTSRDIILDASKHFDIAELKLVRAIHDAPSIFSRMKYDKEKYIAYIRETILEHMIDGDVVYHGLAGHFLLQGIPQVLKVRILANIEDRVAEEMKRENITKSEAKRILQKDDEERRKWSKYLYGIDTNDPILYDLVIHIDNNIDVDRAVDILAGIAKQRYFETAPESRQVIKDEYDAAKLKVALLDSFPYAKVTSDNGAAQVTVNATVSQAISVTERVKKIGEAVEGIEQIEVCVEPTGFVE